MPINTNVSKYIFALADLKDSTNAQHVQILAMYNQPLLLQCNYGQQVNDPDHTEWSFNGTALFFNENDTPKVSNVHVVAALNSTM